MNRKFFAGLMVVAMIGLLFAGASQAAIVSNTPEAAVTLASNGPQALYAGTVARVGDTNAVTGATNSPAALIDLSSYSQVAIDVRAVNTNSESATLTLTFDKSVDNTWWKTGVTNWTLTVAGTTTNHTIIEWPAALVGAVPYWRLGTVIGAATTTPCSVTVKFRPK